MKVTIVASKTCRHRPILENFLKDRGIPYEVKYAEDHPQLVEGHNIHRSPNLMVGNEIICRGMPDLSELEKMLQLDKSE